MLRAAAEPVVFVAPAEPFSRAGVDLGMILRSALSDKDAAEAMEPFYPLVTWACSSCCLVQIGDQVAPENIFEEYAYFSSYSDSWVEHVRKYAYDMKQRFDLGAESLVVEVASNDGYMLQWFVELGVPVLESSLQKISQRSRKPGRPTLAEFFDSSSPRSYERTAFARSDLRARTCWLNTRAQRFRRRSHAAGRRRRRHDRIPALAAAHRGQPVRHDLHEPYSYFSLWSTEQLFARHGLTIFDCRRATHPRTRCASTHGTPPTLRCPSPKPRRGMCATVNVPSATSTFAHERFSESQRTKRALLEFLIDAKRRGKSVVGYGAAGKGMTMLNYCGIRTDFVEFVVDRNPYKVGRYCPGVHIPVLPVDALWDARPDYVLILPWNLREEISTQLAGFVNGGQFVVPIRPPSVVTRP